MFARKLYDLAIPEYQKYLDDYPGRAGRANAYFFVRRMLSKSASRLERSYQFAKVLNDYGDSEFAGPAAFALAEMAFTDKDYATALPLFHRSAGKSKEPAVALAARYFEARCLEALEPQGRSGKYLRRSCGSRKSKPISRGCARDGGIHLCFAREKTRGAEAIRSACERSSKTRIESGCAVRGGLIALELVQADKDKIDNAMAQRAAACSKRAALCLMQESFVRIAQVGFRRLAVSDRPIHAVARPIIKRNSDKLPEAAQAEVLLLAANSERQLDHPKASRGALSADHRQVSGSRGSKGRRLSAADQRL